MPAARPPAKTPSGKPLVIVESPAKAKTISKFLGGAYAVEASIGHVRDLPEASSDLPESLRGNKYARLGVDIENGFSPMYVVPAQKREQIQRLKRLLKDAPSLWLATDEDREGESIAWHLHEVLDPKVPVHRLVFNEITKKAILHALENPRHIDLDLVQAQESRRILDRLFGYEVSAVLWRKIRQNLSAGRVQSVALRLLVDREQERMAFHAATWWDLVGKFTAKAKPADPFPATLVEVGGRRVAVGRDFDPATGGLVAAGNNAGNKPSGDDVVWLDGNGAKDLLTRLAGKPARVKSVEEKPYTQRPPAPFTTSTLQQEAGRKLRWSSRQTMRVAQSLYENGWITYMRTDSTELGQEALDASRALIRSQYGEPYLPSAPRHYKTKVKNAQEAHEAIRPAGSAFRPLEEVQAELGDPDASKLYELIWKRTMASQMTDARGRRLTVLVGVEDAVFRAGGKTIDFAGFQRAYVEGSDDPDADLAEQETLLPPVTVGESVAVASLEAEDHTTQPPARFTEASLIKELDQRGIGRPSTWSSIIGVLLDREYAFRRGTALVPSYTAFAVIRMLRRHFDRVMDYDFTARMEDDLDLVAVGKVDRTDYLRRFWSGNGEPGLEELIQRGLAEADPRELCGFSLGRAEDGREIELRVGRFGLFATDGEARASVAETVVPDEFGLAQAVQLLADAAKGVEPLGEDPATGLPVYVKSGRFGPYVQLGEDGRGDDKPKTSSLLAGMSVDSVDLAVALSLLALPREVGLHPEDGEPVVAAVGRYGPYLRWGKETRSLPSGTSPLAVSMPEAVAILKEPRRRAGQRAAAAPLKELGAHPASGLAITVRSGRYGPYVSDGTIHASLPKDTDPESATLAQAVELMAAKVARDAAGGGRRGGRKKAAKKSAAKKQPARKAAAPGTGVKKAAKKAAKKPAKKAATRKPSPAPDEPAGE